jgi:hypothetical protein
MSRFLFLPLVFFAMSAQAQFSSERITLGNLKARGFVTSGTTPTGSQYQIEFLPSKNGDLYMQTFVSKNNVGYTDYMQSFQMTLKETNESFPSSNISNQQQYQSYFSQDGAIYLVTNEKPVLGQSYNLIFVEINKKHEIRVTFHFGASRGYNSNGRFTEKSVQQSQNPLAGKRVVTTRWIPIPL